ncbi:hypothetical protein [Thermomonospora cellulosilytica]|uniref:Uncharacterized protein n=1 Tax=Thermomonospora cellulosilytica TaxID=1411118 RepID=A0A7W3RB37_9ACTN|nr:hypothetical protein [Thermomonospora cellulosilytica]MBA9005925.1 hypothetical protein [Thermomonospora cellulosilytica]
MTGLGVLGPAPTEGLDGDLRQAVVEDLARLLRERGHEVTVRPLGLTAARDGRTAELWALCRTSDQRVWLCQPGAPFWVCAASDLQDAVRHVQQLLTPSDPRETSPPTAGC